MTRLADHESVFCTDRHTHTHTDILTEDIYVLYIYIYARAYMCSHNTYNRYQLEGILHDSWSAREIAFHSALN